MDRMKKDQLKAVGQARLEVQDALHILTQRCPENCAYRRVLLSCLNKAIYILDGIVEKEKG